MSDQTEFKVELKDLYTAAKVTFPHYANMIVDCADTLNMTLSCYQDQLGHTLNTEPLADAVTMNTECYNLLRRAVIFLNNGATALNDAANDFAKTDEDAARSTQELRKLMDQKLNIPAVPPTLSKDT